MHFHETFGDRFLLGTRNEVYGRVPVDERWLVNQRWGWATGRRSHRTVRCPYVDRSNVITAILLQLSCPGASFFVVRRASERNPLVTERVIIPVRP